MARRGFTTTLWDLEPQAAFSSCDLSPAPRSRAFWGPLIALTKKPAIRKRRKFQPIAPKANCCQLLRKRLNLEEEMAPPTRTCNGPPQPVLPKCTGSYGYQEKRKSKAAKTYLVVDHKFHEEPPPAHSLAQLIRPATMALTTAAFVAAISHRKTPETQPSTLRAAPRQRSGRNSLPPHA